MTNENENLVLLTIVKSDDKPKTTAKFQQNI